MNLLIVSSITMPKSSRNCSAEAMDFSNVTFLELLALQARVADELRTRGITRSSNNPTGDLAEYLFCKAFGWKQAGNSNANVDAIVADGTIIGIRSKAAESLGYNNPCQLSAIRDLGGLHFDFLAGVLFSEDYTVMRAAIIPRAVAVERASFRRADKQPQIQPS
jgi:hypothetical protein